MKNLKFSMAVLYIVLIINGAILKNIIPLSIDWQHDIGMISIFVGFIGFFRVFIKPTGVKSEN